MAVPLMPRVERGRLHFQTADISVQLVCKLRRFVLICDERSFRNWFLAPPRTVPERSSARGLLQLQITLPARWKGMRSVPGARLV